MTVSTFKQPNYTTQTGTAYPLAIDASIAVHNRLAGPFAAHENNVGSPAPDMSVRVDAGHVWNGSSLSEKAAQTVTGFVAPTSGQHRIDRVVINATTGDALRVTGTAVAGSPSATPPAIPAGYVPCCQILITSSDTAITDSMITDERPQMLFGGTLAFGDGSAAAPSVKVGDEQNGLFSPAANTLGLGTGGVEAARIDSSQRLLIGHTAALGTSQTQLETNIGANYGGAALNVFSAATADQSPVLALQRSKNSTKGSHTALASGDTLGYLIWRGSDGSAFQASAYIKCLADAAWGPTDYPSRLELATTADGSGLVVEAMRIDRNQRVGINVTDPTGQSARLAVSENSTNTAVLGSNDAANGIGIYAQSTNESASGAVITGVAAFRSANSAYHFLQMYSDANGTIDTEFRFAGDGNAFADGAFSGSGADYQEYLESLDGSALPVGATVVRAAGKKVRVATASDPVERIIGVVRPKEPNKNSAVIGNAAWNHWTDRYLTDAWGRYILEEYRVFEWEEVVPAKTEKRLVQKTASVESTRYDVVNCDGQYRRLPLTSFVDEPLFTEHPLFDETGAPVMDDETGAQAVHRVPVMMEVEVTIEAAKTIKHNYASYKMPEGVTPPADAKVTTQQRRKPNPLWNKDTPYTPRHDRSEWNLIGMLGQVQIAKGQPVNPRWECWEEISENVELWFIR